MIACMNLRAVEMRFILLVNDCMYEPTCCSGEVYLILMIACMNLRAVEMRFILLGLMIACMNLRAVEMRFILF